MTNPNDAAPPDRLAAIAAQRTLEGIRKLIWRRRHEADVTEAERWAWRARESELLGLQDPEKNRTRRLG